MSAPISDLPSSVSSSGHIDGLGRRVLAFDRETGAILERLHLRPELAAFETPIRQRVDLLASFDDERFARPGSVERDRCTGDLTVLSEFVGGSRLSDLLETAEESEIVPGVDVALGFLLEALSAISSFHSATKCSHGLIDSSRLVVTPAGQVIFLDAAFGSVIERLGLTASRLWKEFGIAAPHGDGQIRLDVTADIAQIALGAVMLVIGRRLREEEYPDAIPTLLMEVVEIAQIRGSHVFATSLQRLLQRSLPLPGRRPYASADDLAGEVRLLLRREIGTEVCRQALIDFTEQMDAQFSGSRTLPLESAATLIGVEPDDGAGLDLDRLALDALESIEVIDEEDVDLTPQLARTSEDGETSSEEFEEISLDPITVEETIEASSARTGLAGEVETIAAYESETAHTVEVADPWQFDASHADPVAAEPAGARSTGDAAEAPPVAESAAMELTPGPPNDDFEAATLDAAGASADEEPSAEIEKPSWSLSRRLKRQQKSARARKDKLRSATEQKPAQVAPQAAKPQQGGWIVSPDRAAAFAPAVPDTGSAPAPPAVGRPVSPPMPVYPAATAPPVVPVAAPPAPVIPMPVYGAPAPPAPAPPAPPAPIRPVAVAPPPSPKPVAAAGAPLRLKAEPPSGYVPPRANVPMSAQPYVHRGPMFEPESPRAFPWKLAIAAILIVGIAVVVGRAYIPSRSAPDPEPPAATASLPEPAPAAAAKVQTGEILIQTQPAGARVLLDGKPAGQTPLKLDKVPVGRHVLTFVSSAGEVTRTVRVAAAKPVSVDISIFSGWVAIFAPIVLDVSVNGRSLGTTELDRLMLPPGRHELTLSNKELGYKVVKEIEVEPGEVRSVTIEPKGEVSFNAIPWAEVLMDGSKLGDTPIANVRVPLGLREFVFKHPQYGERRVSASIRADQPTAIAVDFTRPQ
jgi:hypothetical protein